LVYSMITGEDQAVVFTVSVPTTKSTLVENKTEIEVYSSVEDMIVT
jgi:hypothetical protein